jgi:hypothetical protein
VNRGLSPWIKGFSQYPVDLKTGLFTLSSARLSHSKTPCVAECNTGVTDVAVRLRSSKP